MDEHQIEQGLRDVLLAEPPLRVDPDRMVDAAVRNRRHRRAGITAGMAILAAAVVAGAVALTGPGQPQPASPPKPTQHQELEHEMARMAAHLRYVLPRLLPQAARIRVEYELLEPPAVRTGVQMKTQVTFTDSAGFAEFQLFIDSSKSVVNDPASWNKECAKVREHQSTEGRPMRCSATERADHSVLRFWEAGDGPSSKSESHAPVKVTEADMTHLRTDGGAVVIVNHRFDVDGKPRSRFPLTEAQEEALATDPVLVMLDPGE